MKLKTDFLSASDPKSPPHKLREISKSQNRILLRKIAEHDSAPPDLLATLSNNSDPEIRSLVGCNKNTPIEIVRRLARDQSPDVRYFMAGEYHLAEEILRILADDENPYVRARAMQTLEGLALEHELTQGNFIAIKGTHGMLGALLVASEVLDGRRADQCVYRAKEKAIPLGRYLVCEGLVTKKVILTALKCQQLLREQKMELPEVIQEIRMVNDEFSWGPQ
jgi:hypothetical protein